MKIVSIALSRKKGTRKAPVETARVLENYGLEGDAHAGAWHRQISCPAGPAPFRTGCTSWWTVSGRAR